MQRWNSQTRIIVACAVVLASIDIYVRFATVPKSVSSSVVTAQEFRLTDKQGNIRAIMKTDNGGEPGLVMYDRTGTPRLQLDSFQTTPSLILMDQNGEKRAYYGMTSPTGDGELSFMTPSGSTTAAIKIHGNNSALFTSQNNAVLQSGVMYSQTENEDLAPDAANTLLETYQTETRSISR